MMHQNNSKGRGQRGGRGRGERGGRGRGDGQGRGKGREETAENADEVKKEAPKAKPSVNSLASMDSTEKKLAMMFAFLHKYLEAKYKANGFGDQTYMFHKAQQF